MASFGAGQDESEPSESLVQRVLSAYATVDQRVEAFAHASRLACPPRCGACCLSTEVRATVLEMIPMAETIARAGHLVLWLERLAAVGEGAPCAVYRPDDGKPEHGRCGFYAVRPTVCRLFGFAGRRDKRGAPTFSACRRLRTSFPDAARAAREAVEAGLLDVPLFDTLARHVDGLDPGLGSRLLPINEALRVALEREGLLDRMRADSDGPGRRPPMPRAA